jgi:hypothetical protein
MDTTHHNTAETWVAGYADYLRDAVGAADATRARHLPTVRRFIAACSGPGGPDWTGLSVQQVAEWHRQVSRERAWWSRVGQVNGQDDDASRPNLRRLSIPC